VIASSTKAIKAAITSRLYYFLPEMLEYSFSI